MPDFPPIQPIIPTRAPKAFDDPRWIFELKHDGFRSLVYISNGKCALVSRKGNHYKSFRPLCEALAGLRVRDAVLDGELVCLDGEGRSHFNTLLHRRGQPILYAFDLLYLNGRDFRSLPLVHRKTRLRKVIERSACPALVYAQHIDGNGTALYREICERDLEGIVCKRKDAPYTSAKWLKIMNPLYTQHDGRHEMFDAFHERKTRIRAYVPTS